MSSDSHDLPATVRLRLLGKSSRLSKERNQSVWLKREEISPIDLKQGVEGTGKQPDIVRREGLSLHLGALRIVGFDLAHFTHSSFTQHDTGSVLL